MKKVIINRHPYKASIRNEFAFPLKYRTNPILIRWLELYDYFSSLTVKTCNRHQILANTHEVGVIPYTEKHDNLRSVFTNLLEGFSILKDIDIDYLELIEYDDEQYVVHFSLQYNTVCSDCGAENPYDDEDDPCWCCGHKHTAVVTTDYEVANYIPIDEVV